MQFNTYTFVLFFAIVLAVHYSCLSWTSKKRFLLGASYLFYAGWNPAYLSLVLLSTVVDWQAARSIDRARSAGSRRAFLWLSISANLGLLAYFKYANWMLDSVGWVASLLGVNVSMPVVSVLLPVGISFYTFQTLSYTLDVYRGRMKPADSFLDYALYVAFFPQLVAGPIVRACDFLPQCRNPRAASWTDFEWGTALFILGLWQKVVLADGITAPIAEAFYDQPGAMTFNRVWAGKLAFSAQLYFDFAGYSSCAIGLARMLGFSLKLNFNAPYCSRSMAELWRRWHVSLSTWIRDYLYFSLRGRKTTTLRQRASLIASMMLIGLWHGASWHFVAWGFVQGVYLTFETNIRGGLNRVTPAILQPAAQWGLMFFMWLFLGSLFRAHTIEQAFRISRGMINISSFSFAAMQVSDYFSFQSLLAVMTAVLLVITHLTLQTGKIEPIWQRLPRVLRVVGLVGLLFSTATMAGQDRAFIYFQF